MVKVLEIACRSWGFLDSKLSKARRINDAELQDAVEKAELRVARGEKSASELVGGYMVSSRLSGDMIMTCISEIKVYRGVSLENAGKIYVEGL